MNGARVCFLSPPGRDLQVTLNSIRQRFGSAREDACFKLISGSIFLRFFCPAILSPSLFSLCQGTSLGGGSVFFSVGLIKDWLFFCLHYLSLSLPPYLPLSLPSPSPLPPCRVSRREDVSQADSGGKGHSELGQFREIWCEGRVHVLYERLPWERDQEHEAVYRHHFSE